MGTQSSFAIEPPVEPMLAKISEAIPVGRRFLFEPKWDGFRALVFRGGADLYIQSRDLRPLDRYFPELHEALLARLPDGCVIDGEIVIVTPEAWTSIACRCGCILRHRGSRSWRAKHRRPSWRSTCSRWMAATYATSARTRAARRFEALLGDAVPPLHLTPVTRDVELATRWLAEFEGAGLDGVIAKPAAGPYQPGKRAMLKIKHARTAECVVAGFRWHKTGPQTLIGSLLLGLYDGKGRLHHVGVTSSFTMATRKALAGELEPLRKNALESHPWKEWAEAGAAR